MPETPERWTTEEYLAGWGKFRDRVGQLRLDDPSHPDLPGYVGMLHLTQWDACVPPCREMIEATDRDATTSSS